MKFSAVAAIALAAAVEAAPTAANSPFGLFAATTTQSPINMKTIVAHGEGLWIGGETQTSCELPPSKCPPGKYTALRAQGSDIYMDSVVPAGQPVYIGQAGRLRYTAAHESTGPDGAQFDGFVHDEQGNGSGKLSWNGEDFAACEDSESGHYRIYAASMTPAGKDCIDFTIATEVTSGDAAWQYD